MLKALNSLFYMDRFSISTLFVRRWPIILVVTALIFGAALWQNHQKAPSYFGSFTVTVQSSRNYPKNDQLILQSSQTQDLQAVISTTQAWVADPYYVRKALEGAGIVDDNLSLKDFSKVFQVVSPVALSSSYQVQYVGTSSAEVTRVYASLRTVLDSAQADYDSKQGDLTIILAYTDPTVTTQGSGLPLVPVAGLLVGLVFASVVAAMYDRSSKA